MREMNREIAGMIGELQFLEQRKKANGIDGAKKDRYGFEMETPGAFSMEPLGFVETAMRLQTEALELFRIVSKVSRFSPLFPRMSAQLERMVYRLGSCCLTKAVLEQQAGESFRLLEVLTIGGLRGMAAFNFRKCYAAFMESRAEGGYKPEAFELSVRWAALDRRLEATGNKIEKIISGEIKIEPAEEEKPLPPRKESAADQDPRTEAAPFTLKSRALPVDMDAVRTASMQDTVGEAPAPDRTDEARTLRSRVNPRYPESGTYVKGANIPSEESERDTESEAPAPDQTGEARTLQSRENPQCPESGTYVNGANVPSEESERDTESQAPAPDQTGETRTLRSRVNPRYPESVTYLNGSYIPSEEGSTEHETGTSANISDVPEETREPESADEEFMRDVLLSDAVERADRKDYEAAVFAEGEDLTPLRQRYLEREEHRGFAHLKRLGFAADAGPPDEEAEELFSDRWSVISGQSK